MLASNRPSDYPICQFLGIVAPPPCNGMRPPLGSKPSVAIAAYITWLSEGHDIRMNAACPAGKHAVPQLTIDAQTADSCRGAEIYSNRCATCHGDDGKGDEDNPPVWGSSSYNDGAGLANNIKLASWLKLAMPLDEADLSDQEALDVAAFVNKQERSRFVLQDHLPARFLNRSVQRRANLSRLACVKRRPLDRMLRASTD